jgi:hypothetical protein
VQENRLQRAYNDLGFQVSSLSQQLTAVSQEGEVGGFLFLLSCAATLAG